jgi:DNA-binding response OmpR family regulator
VKIFVVDDEQLIIDVLLAYLEREGYEVYSATNGADALKKIREIKPDFLILDLMLPDISGEEICRQVRQNSDVPILMLTAKTAEDDRIQGIVIGADDYVTKPFSPREVVVRVQAILRRVGKLNQQNKMSFNSGELVLDLPSYEVIVRGESVDLTPIEFKLLAGMAKHPGRVYSRMDLLEKVQTDVYEGYERSIDVHIKNLRKKIEMDTKNPVYILTVFGIGYKFGGKADVSYPAH